jgi:hypothetical protein
MFKEMKREPGAEQSMLDCEKGSAQALVNDASNRLAPADSGREGEQR